ncbi:MAG: SpvB/TcaC N-terminal domain-containing protein [Aureispira sp.]
MDNTPNNQDQGPQPFASNLAQDGQHQAPEISLPKGGGALKGIDEKLNVNPVTGSSGMSIPLPVAPARGGFSPALSISYSSGAGNGLFGMGWGLALPNIQRKTNQELPTYQDKEESDTFILAGAEDLVPKLQQDQNTGQWNPVTRQEGDFLIKEYRPRIEGSWLRIEQWVDTSNKDRLHWRTISTNNTITVYGDTPSSCIQDPAAPNGQKIFEWKISYSYDNLGNLIVYEYQEEDLVGVLPTVYEKNRNRGNVVNTYLKRVHYGNKEPYHHGDSLPVSDEFLFETLLDYGDHSSSNVSTTPDQDWVARRDAFSNFRAGFDLRTYRLCARVLLFHKFDLAHQPVKKLLVSALELTYEDYPEKTPSSHPLEGFTYLKSAQTRGYLYDTATNSYEDKDQPPVEFYYQGHAWDTTLKELDNYEQMPVGLNQGSYQWMDFYGKGIAGVLSQQNQAWYYKENLGGGQFSPAKLLAEKPSFAGLQFQDLEGNGERQLVNYSQAPQGFFEWKDGEQWNNFKYFEALPNRNLSNDPYARFIDLDGDGRADLLITADHFFQWYPSKGKEGFGAANRVYTPLDEEEGPRIVFADQEQSIFLADMTGDGMTDIVRIRNGEVCYWANKGYGNFSAKITMQHAPLFDHEEQFNPQYLYLLDIDGSGTTDLAYYHKNALQVWCNWSGNEFVEAPKIIAPFPSLAPGARLDVVDLLGTGTSCLVWSSSHQKDQNTPLKYIHLTAGKKPHLLYQYTNNLGASTELTYSHSTKFYLADKQAGTPWATKLPFPVHVVEKVTSIDHIQQTIFTQQYRYAHGYYDQIEREFRGFGRVETLDTTSLDELLSTGANNVQIDHYQVPIKTISWYHTGACFKEKDLIAAYEEEYYQNSPIEQPIAGRILPAGLTGKAYIEAHRALKGLPLRQEVYSLDNNPHPYSTSRQSYALKEVQPHEGQQYASFVVVPEQQFSYNYERNPDDPRISQELVLATDKLGIPIETASIIYPRLFMPPSAPDLPWMVEEEQRKLHIITRKISLTEDIDLPNAYRLRTAYEEQAYELLQASWAAGLPYFEPQGLKQVVDTAMVLDYIEEPDSNLPATIYKRLHGHTKVQLLKDDLSGPLPIGSLSSLGIPYKTYQLAYTALQLTGDPAQQLKGLFTTDAGTNLLQGLPALSSLGYADLENNGNWWLHSGTTLYDVQAANNFYLPYGVEDILGNQSTMQYDAYQLLPTSVTDVLGNTSSAAYDYRVLQPQLLTDINDNQSAVFFDELGIVTKSAILGKIGQVEGDTLEHPTAELRYDFYNYKDRGQPNYIHSKVREEHYSQNPVATWQESYEYSSGMGEVIMAKVQTKGGKAKKWDSTTNTLLDIDTTTNADYPRRWIGNGRTIINNKGLPIKQYEPYFSVTHKFESAPELVEIGYSPTLYYDAAGRNNYTELANGTIVKTEFDSWYSKQYDSNDTIKESVLYTTLSSNDKAIVDGSTPPTNARLRAIWQAVQHANTPTTVHTDCLGRAIYACEELEAGITYAAVFTQTDLAGRTSRIYDQLATAELLQNPVGDYTTNRGVSSIAQSNLLGQGVKSWTAVKGTAWTFTDALGRLVRLWDNPDDTINKVEYSTQYDNAHRPLKTYVKKGSTGTPICFAKTIYGEDIPASAGINASANNLLGQAYQSYDQSGVITTTLIDFKGNPLEMNRQMTTTYDALIDWDGTVGLETEVFTTQSSYDALNRPVVTTLPDGSILQPTYNVGGYMEQLNVDVLGLGNSVTYLEGQDFDAKGQQQHLKLGNGTVTQFFYEATTFRLSNLLTTKNSEKLQDLQYTYDAVGNAVDIKDKAQSTYYYNNEAVSPQKTFQYDALYRLTAATGRQHANAGIVPNTNKDFYQDLPAHSIQSAVTNYTQRYEYDKVGNIILLNQVNAWNRSYTYATNNATNQLLETKLSGHTKITYTYDHHGNMKALPHLQALEWNHQDELVQVKLDASGNVVHYNYDGGGQRTRKIITNNGLKKKERLYLGGVERYQEYDNNGVVTLERWTLQVEGLAQVDTLTVDNSVAVGTPLPVARYQYRDRLGSSTIEANERGQVISYEEYYPYGASAYRAAASGVDLSLKRYRFTGKERDEETGLDYFGVRYYASWLGRWTSGDPGDFVDGLNLYRYTQNNPVNEIDREGYSTENVDPPPVKKKENTIEGGNPLGDAASEIVVNSDTMDADSSGGWGDRETGTLYTSVYFVFDEDMEGVSLEEKQAYVDAFAKAVTEQWTTYTIDGTPVNLDGVTFKLLDETYNASDPYHNLFTVGGGVSDPMWQQGDTSQTSYVQGNKGYMYYLGGNPSSYAAHEFGHIFGLSDRYHEGVLGSGTEVNRDPRLTGRLTVPMILNKAVDQDYDPFNNFYAGSGNDLTPMQMSIVFNASLQEQKYPTGIYIDHERFPKKYDAIKYNGLFHTPQAYIQRNGVPTKKGKLLHFVMKNPLGGLLYYKKKSRRRVLKPIFDMTKDERKFNIDYVKMRLGHVH